MKAGQRIHVDDSLSDDFGAASRHVVLRVVDEHYPYRHGWLWHVVSGIIYYVIAPLPLAAIKVLFGVRLRGREVLRAAGGCYLYCNHTNWLDSVIPYLLAFPRRAYVVAGATAVSLPVLGRFVPMLGAIPLNSTEPGKEVFRQALEVAVRRGGVVAIFPEAHMWPYYNGVRLFPSYSFSYPVRTGATVVPCAVTYRCRPVMRRRAPHPTVTVGPPIAPDVWRDSPDPKTLLRDATHEFISRTITEQRSYAWVDYDLPSAE